MGVSRRRLLGTALALPAASLLQASSDPVAELVDQIRNSMMHGQSGVAEVLARLISNPAKLLAVLGTPAEGGITPLYNDFQITILNIVWAPLMVLRLHDHNMWASVGVYGGREDNVFWEPGNDSIRAKSAASLGTGEVGSLARDAIHSVINPTRKLTGAIHVYGGDFFHLRDRRSERVRR
ncbi:MAG: hypothetical protein O3A63_07125 [Proteobacteria bacterium]|nr:hypothetical protein [Pseudomonadota bacterium]